MGLLGKLLISGAFSFAAASAWASTPEPSVAGKTFTHVLAVPNTSDEFRLWVKFSPEGSSNVEIDDNVWSIPPCPADPQRICKITNYSYKLNGAFIEIFDLNGGGKRDLTFEVSEVGLTIVDQEGLVYVLEENESENLSHALQF